MENTALTQNSCETTKQITLEGWLYCCEDIYSLFYQYFVRSSKIRQFYFVQLALATSRNYIRDPNGVFETLS